MTLFTLQKTLAYLIMPVGLLWLLLLGAAVLAWRRKQRGAGFGLLVVAMLYWGLGNLVVGSALMARLERDVPALEMATTAPFDAVFVLGGGSEESPTGEPQLGFAGDRLQVAAKLWHAGKARVLVASGFSHDGLHGDRDSGEETRTLWRNMGVPDRAIRVVKEPCWITRDEIAAYRRLQDSQGWKRMALVSSASHLPRAMALAGRAGLRVTPVGADWLGRDHAFQLQFLVPQGDGFLRSQRACWEFLGRKLGR